MKGDKWKNPGTRAYMTGILDGTQAKIEALEVDLGNSLDPFGPIRNGMRMPVHHRMHLPAQRRWGSL